MENKYIIAIDQGTTSSRALIFNKKGELEGIQQQEFKQIYPKPGWVEQNPVDIFESQFGVLQHLLSNKEIKPNEVAAVGITNQRETTILWDKKTGDPVYNAIVWQDKRTTEYCSKLKSSGFGDYIHEATGLIVDSYFSASKIRWILNNVPGVKQKAIKGNLLFGTVDTWLIWKLTKGKLHITDHSNASRTMLYNIHTLTWDKKLLELFDLSTQFSIVDDRLDETEDLRAFLFANYSPGFLLPVIGKIKPYAGIDTFFKIEENITFAGINCEPITNGFIKFEYQQSSEKDVEDVFNIQVGYVF